MPPKPGKILGAPAESKAAFQAPYFWAPSIALLIIPAWEIANALTKHNFTVQAYWVHRSVLNILAAVCFSAAIALAVYPGLGETVERHLDSLSAAPRRARIGWLVAAYLGFVIWFSFIRYCQYRGYELVQDTACSLNQAYTFLHHGSLYLSIFGVHQLSIHLFFLMPLLSPLLLVWNSPLVLLLAQNLFICAAPFAVYALVELATGSSAAGFAGLLLAVSSRFMYEFLASSLLYAPLIAFLPWAMYFAERRRWIVFGVLLALMNAFPEQVPFTFFGIGLYLLISPDAPPFDLGSERRNHVLAGTIVCAASVILWFAEMSLIKHFSRQEAIHDYAGSAYWLMFQGVVPRGTPYERIFPEIATHPLRTLGSALSIYRLFPVLRLLFSMGFLCLLAPAAMLPFLATAIPHVLAASSAPVAFLNYKLAAYPDFAFHQGAYVFGPLLWATSLGVRRAHSLLARKNAAHWLLAWAFVFSGFGFKYADPILMPLWRDKWFDTLAPVAEAVPPKARLWVDEYAAPPLALRRWIKIIQWGPDEPYGYHRLFMPDYVLFDVAFTWEAKPPYRDRMLTFLYLHGFRKVAQDGQIVLLKNPSPAADPEADIHDWIQLPPPDTNAAQWFTGYLRVGPVGPA